MKRQFTKIVAVMVCFVMVFGTAMSSFALEDNEVVKYNRDGNGKATSINTINLAPYTYYNVGNDGKTDADDQFLYDTVKNYLQSDWAKLASAIFSNEGSYVTNFNYSECFTSDSSSDYKGDVAATLGSVNGVSKGDAGDDSFKSTGLTAANSLKDVRKKVGSEIASAIKGKITTDEILAEGASGKGMLPELDDETSGTVLYNIVTSTDEYTSNWYDYSSFGIAFYDFDLQILAADGLEYVTAAEGYENVEEAADAGIKGVKYQTGGSKGTNSITYTENNSKEDVEVEMGFENSKTTTLTTSVENSEEYTFEQMTGSETEFATSFGGLLEATQHITFEFTFGQAYSTTRGQENSAESSTTNTVSTTVTIPAHTAIGIQQEDSNTTIELEYDTPVAISFKVAVFGARGEAYDDGAAVQKMHTADYEHGYFFTSFGGKTSKAGYTACENLYKRAITNKASGFDASNGSYHRWYKKYGAAGSERESTSEQGINWNTVLSSGIIDEDTVKKMATNIPMISSGSSMKIEGKSISSNIYGIEPLYNLDAVKLAFDFKSYNLRQGDQLRLDLIQLEGLNKYGVDYYTFDKDDGHWVVCDDEGNLTDDSAVTIDNDELSGEQILHAEEDGTGYIKWVLFDDVEYTAKNDPGTVTSASFFGSEGEDPEVSTAIVKVNVKNTPFKGGVTVDGTYEGIAGDPEADLDEYLTVTIEDESGKEVLRDYTWEAKELKGITVEEDGTVSFSKEGTYHVRAVTDENSYSDWTEITATPERALSSITFKAPKFAAADVTLTEAVPSLEYDLESYLKYYDQYGDEWEGSLPEVSFALAKATDDASIDAGKLVVTEAGSYTVNANTDGITIKPVTITVKDTREYDAKVASKKLDGASAKLSKSKDIDRDDKVILTLTPAKGKYFKNKPAVTADNAVVESSKINSDKTVTVVLDTYTADTVITVEGKAVPIPVSKVTIDKTAKVVAGQSITLSAKTLPSDAYDKTITWKSSNSNIATVTKSGKVIANKSGTVTITATAASGKKASCKVTVIKPVSMLKGTRNGHKSFTLNWTKVKGADGYDIYGAKCYGTFAKIKSVKSGTLTAKVTKLNGKALSKASYKFKVKAYKLVDGKKVYLTTTPESHIQLAYSCDITNADKLTITTGDAITLKKGNSKTLNTKVSIAKDMTQLKHIKEVRFVSSDSSVAAVSEGGKITAKAKGECYVYAVAVNGMYDRIKVTVK